MSHPIFSNNKYVFWKVHADVIKVNINTSYFEKYVEVKDGNFNPLKFKTKKLAKDYIEKNMLNKFDSYPNKNIKLYKNIKIPTLTKDHPDYWVIDKDFNPYTKMA